VVFTGTGGGCGRTQGVLVKVRVSELLKPGELEARTRGVHAAGDCLCINWRSREAVEGDARAGAAWSGREEGVVVGSRISLS
jgi:hypothetical protein